MHGRARRVPVLSAGCFLPTTRTYDVLLLDELPVVRRRRRLVGPLRRSARSEGARGRGDFSVLTQDPKNVPGGCLTQDSAVVADTLGPSWGGAVLFSGIDARHLRLLSFWLYDDDVALNDAVADCQLVLNPTDRDRTVLQRFEKVLAGGVFEVSCSSPKRKDVAKLHVRIRPH